MRGPTIAQAGSASSTATSSATAPGWTCRSGLQTSTYSMVAGRRHAPVGAAAVAQVAAGDDHRHASPADRSTLEALSGAPFSTTTTWPTASARSEDTQAARAGPVS